MFITRAQAITSHAFAFREGDAFVTGTDQNGAPLGAGPAGVNALPDPNDAGWIDLDTVEDWEDTITDEKKQPIWRGIPGNLVKEDEITTLQGLDIKMTTAKMTPFAVEAFYRTATKLNNNPAQFVPLSATPRKIWLMLQRYNHLNELIWAANLWVVARCHGGMKGGKGELVMPTFEMTLLYSGCNTAAIDPGNL
jgi:hypothetical protein